MRNIAIVQHWTRVYVMPGAPAQAGEVEEQRVVPKGGFKNWIGVCGGAQSSLNVVGLAAIAVDLTLQATSRR